jgi:hypothetical protein
MSKRGTEIAGRSPRCGCDGGTRVAVAASPAKEQNMLKSYESLIKWSTKYCCLPLRAGALLVLASALIGAMDPSSLPDQPLQAPEGVTALSGQVVDSAGNGLAGVQLLVGDVRTVSDAAGRFLVSPAIPGKTVLQIDGRKAGVRHDTDYGFYEVRVDARAGQTTVLPFRNWLPRIDHSHDVKLDSPTKSEVVVRTPALPDFELRIPAGVVIRDVDGKIVDKVGITVVAREQMPIPVPDHFALPMIPIIQPGGACLYDAQGGIGTATMVFPNVENELPKARATLWRYEPDANGWAPYGMGTVSSDGRQIIPDAGVVITDFASAECQPETRTRQRPPERPDLRRPAPTAPGQPAAAGGAGRP